LARCHKKLGETLFETGQVAEAVEAWRRALAVFPDDAELQNDTAWHLATHSDAKLRNAEEAVRRAEKAVEMAPNDANFRNTLGVARYRAGDWRGAVEALGDGRTPIDVLFLAMAQWQLGEKEQARRLYDKVAQWIDTTKPQDEALRRFRAEAAALLKTEAKANVMPE
jgi:tetratricopeptide (TPR) repeat protein